MTASNAIGLPRHFTFLPPPRSIEWLAGSVEQTLRVQTRIDTGRRPQSYCLTINANGISIVGADDAAVFYARQTLTQLIRQCDGPMPCVSIEDWPDFLVRGVMYDISRDKVPTLETLFALIDELAEWKFNQLQLYVEHTFAYRDHETVWKQASPITADEMRQIDRYCRARFIELVPNQNGFGHMERWLKHEPYHQLAECPEGAFYFDSHRPAATLNPLDPRSIQLVRSLHDELLNCFQSGKWFNVGCDETMELGMGKSREACERRGRERVYLDFLKLIHESVASHGRTMMFWGDIILHRPELIDELPRPIVALDWGYEADHPFEQECAAFAKVGVPHYVCPGTSSWCSIAGRTANTIGSILNAAHHGLANGAAGLLVTDWGDHGHWQYLPVSYVGLAMGAAAAWNVDAVEQFDLARALDVHVFRDASSTMGRLVMDLGNVYQLEPSPRKNGTLLFWLLQKDSDHVKALGAAKASIDDLKQMEAAVEAIVSSIGSASMDRADAATIIDEFKNAASMMRAACRRGRALLGDATIARSVESASRDRFITEHRRLWLLRNRVGGLDESVARFVR